MLAVAFLRIHIFPAYRNRLLSIIQKPVNMQQPGASVMPHDRKHVCVVLLQSRLSNQEALQKTQSGFKLDRLSSQLSALQDQCVSDQVLHAQLL